jgi:D-tyrosyl-tRNA(Tyr) deacylase
VNVKNDKCHEPLYLPAKTVLNLRLSEADDSGKLVSILELPGDILIIPQATLGGRAKGRSVQYHGNINKQLGEQLYAQFADRCREAVEQSSRQSRSEQCVVRCGTYGNRQVLSMETNGPYSHIIEI